MAYCFYNGVKLPELPSDVLATYPYCWIRKNDNTQHYDLIFTKVLGYYDATAGGIVYGENSATAEIAHYRVAYADASTADSWDSYQTTETWMALDTNRTVMWSNHYIPNGSLTATEMYFDGSAAIPDAESYEIQKDTMVAIADQVRRLCNTENTMTPAQIESNLGGLNIDLMETYVTSTTTDQVIYPDEGYYGFSKVTVGSVDFGGGSGTGGDSGDGGDSGGTGDGTSEAETLPNVNDGSYGSDAEYTGMVYIGDELYPAFTENVLSQYPYIIKSSGLVNGDGFFCSEAPFVAKDGNELYELEPTYIQSSAEHGVSYRLLQSVDENGDFVGWYADGGSPYSWSFAEYGNDVISWSSHNLYGEDEGTIDTKFFSGTSAIKQVSTDSNGEEQYAKVSDSDMHALAVVTQNLTGTTEEMNMRDIISELEKHSVDTWEGGSY